MAERFSIQGPSKPVPDTPEVGKDYGPGLQAFVQVGTRRDPFTMEVPREPIVEILRDALGKMIEKRDAAIAVVQRAAAATRGES